MRIELDANGYVLNIFWGCMTGECIEYKGEIPAGYSSLYQWANEAEIKAYYLDINGNLVLDYARQLALEELYAAQEADHKPVVWKDLNTALEPLIGNYTEVVAVGDYIVTTDARSIVNYMPRVKLTRINPHPFTKIDLFIQGRQMLRNDAVTETINGITFTKSDDGGITITGKATADVSYDLSGDEENDIPIFGLQRGLKYYLNIGMIDCEMKCYNGDTTEQVYVGSSGIISLAANKDVTQVLLKIPSGTTINETIYPMLEYGTSPSNYEEYACRYLCIDISEFSGLELYPSEELYPSNTLLLPETGIFIDYISIENGSVKLSSKGLLYNLGSGSVNLFNGYNFVYTTQTAQIELTYKTNILEATIKGDIYNNDGTLVSGASGILNSMQFISTGLLRYTTLTAFDMDVAKPTSYGRLGFFGDYNGGFEPWELNLHAIIPANMKILSARITLLFNPVYVTSGSDAAWSQVRNVKLYKRSGGKWTRAYHSDNNYMQDTIWYDWSNENEISGAFGDNGWTSKVATDTNHEEQQTVSIDLANALDNGGNIFIIRSDYTPPDMDGQDSSLAAALLTGAAVAILNVTGYTNYSKEV